MCVFTAWDADIESQKKAHNGKYERLAQERIMPVMGGLIYRLSFVGVVRFVEFACNRFGGWSVV